MLRTSEYYLAADCGVVSVSEYHCSSGGGGLNFRRIVNECCNSKIRDNETLSFMNTQAIEGLDIEAAMAKLDDDTVTSDIVKELFAALGDKAKVSSTRVAGLPSAQLSLAELEESKEHLQAKLEHLRSAGQVFALKSVDGKS